MFGKDEGKRSRTRARKRERERETDPWREEGKKKLQDRMKPKG